MFVGPPQSREVPSLVQKTPLIPIGTGSTGSGTVTASQRKELERPLA
jgi:hypothetical protein